MALEMSCGVLEVAGSDSAVGFCRCGFCSMEEVRL